MENIIDIIKKDKYNKDVIIQMLKNEKYHKHEIIIDNDGIVRWKENPITNKYINKIGLSTIYELFETLGYDKNTEIVRKLFRDRGYSLFGYWETFYYEKNNKNTLINGNTNK